MSHDSKRLLSPSHRTLSTDSSKGEDKKKSKPVSSLSHSLFDSSSMDDSEDLFSPKETPQAKPEQVGGS